MDWMSIKNKLCIFVKEYKFIILIFLAGIVLMLIPSGGEQPSQSAVPAESASMPDLQDSLSELLGSVKGAGKVKILLSQTVGEQIIYQTDILQKDEQYEEETVILSGTGKEQMGMVRQVLSPQYRGAVVLCQGADNPSVKLAIVEAVSRATGLSTDKIAVLKMK